MLGNRYLIGRSNAKKLHLKPVPFTLLKMTHKHVIAHYIGLSASFLCLIHCLALPFVTPFLPLLAGHNHWLVESIFILLITLSTLTIYRGYRAHNDRRALITGIIAFVFLASSLLFPHNPMQITLSVAGSMMMMIAHVANYKLCRVTKPCC